MKKLLIFMLIVGFAMPSFAQSQQELMEAYKNGTLTQSQIDNLKNQQNSSGKNVRRTRTVNVTSGAREVETDMTDMPADPQQGLAESRVAGTAATVRNVSTRIFGHDLFSNRSLTFEPNLNIATPDNYVLGPGDEVIIDTWGDAHTSQAYTISPDGKIHVPNVGPITLSGLTVSEATRRARGALAAIYEGLNDGSVKMKLSLGSIRSIQVNVMGEVGRQGTYTLPSLATLFHALHVSGGVNNLGTLRSIKLYRSGKLHAEVDVYDYILNGKSDSDIALRDGDLISVMAYGSLVEISGKVKRPMFYEMCNGESVADVIEF
ncbi:MAG: polysaccharide biosynthesis/export family protein, partial [Alistipes sp.]|nr:polysaccharide biosynthesis/export family protein [Alistipes sp.]